MESTSNYGDIVIPLALDNLGDLVSALGSYRAHSGGSDAHEVGHTLSDQLGADDPETFDVSASEDGTHTEVHVFGAGDPGSRKEVLTIFAQFGATGIIECIDGGSADDIYRYRLADGKVATESAFCVYASEIDSGAWLVQIPTPRATGDDRVAVAANETVARDQLAEWLRHDYPEQSVPGDDTDAVITAATTHGLTFTIRQVPAVG